MGMKLFSGNANSELAKRVAESLGAELSHCAVSRFADGEIQVEIHESVRGEHAFVLQSTCPPVNENYMELFIML
ncbi:MAG TPA: ribose-phosphate pyrophosphokinase-like domain-containing protein, partial [Pseudobdellovibrionaceae bacterium]|nr:ribose-phosphate pyrophosphokinase-like domain-containing protein [Pseudobdellovibrionaceae bacterium]